MEKSRKGIPPEYTIFSLPPTEAISADLEQLNVLPSVRNRFFPHVLRLAGQEINGVDLIERLGVAVYDYASSKPPIRRDEALMRMAGSLPDYLRLLMPRGSLLESTVELLEMRWQKPSELTSQTEAREIDDETKRRLRERKGAPRGIKDLLDIPEHLRTDEQIREIENWRKRRLGKKGLDANVSRSHYPNQPGQRKLAEKQAAREHRRQG